MSGEAILPPSSSVGVKTGGSKLVSKGLLVLEAFVNRVGFGLVGSRPEGYDRGSGRLEYLERDKLDGGIDGAKSLFPVDVENVDEAIESRERNDEVVDEDNDEATELRLWNVSIFQDTWNIRTEQWKWDRWLWY